MTTQMKNTISEESGNDVCGDVGGPEAGEADGQLLVLVEITQVEHHLF
jgi:hypothetical protein